MINPMCSPYEAIRLDNQLCFPLYACAKEIVRQYRMPLEPLGLTYTQYVVMMAFWEHGGMTEKELGEIVHLDSGTLAPLLKRLEKQGLVNRVRPQNNERKLFISLTKEGEALKQKAVHVPEAMSCCMDLTLEEANTLQALLKKALHSMEMKAAEDENNRRT